ncbi:MAG: hypothetical protein NZL89_03500 [Leptospiraceae bacterium]|nr:hypothetical protein [Leptospiraceae bacterium]
MNFIPQLLAALHWLGVAFYSGSLIFFLAIFERVYHKYRAYRYVDNFRAEVVVLLWKLLNFSFVVIVLSGVAMAGLRGKPVLRGLYGLFFSAKLALWLLQLWLLQDVLKPFLVENYTEDATAAERQRRTRSWLALVLLFMLLGLGMALRWV